MKGQSKKGYMNICHACGTRIPDGDDWCDNCDPTTTTADQFGGKHCTSKDEAELKTRLLEADPDIVRRIQKHIREKYHDDCECECDTKEEPLLKLHLGCGTRRLPGFVHVDGREDTNPDFVADVRCLAQLEDNTAKLIYACHVLEHIPRPEVQDVLAEWRRVLAPGGTLRVSVPDFATLADLYHVENVSLWRLMGPLYGRQDYPENSHYVCYDYEYLAWTLGEAGFYDVQRWLPDIVHPLGYDDFSKARINHSLISLNVEATA